MLYVMSFVGLEPNRVHHSAVVDHAASQEALLELLARRAAERMTAHQRVHKEE